MSVSKVYRFEKVSKPFQARDAGAPSDAQHSEIMQHLGQIITMLGEQGTQLHEAPALREEAIETLSAEEVATLTASDAIRQEIGEISSAIEDTKREIATLHFSNGLRRADVSSAPVELNAVIESTEAATNQILKNCEEIDKISESVRLYLAEDEQNGLQDIQSRIVEIYEACNFQDLAGQRLNKVINTLKFVDERLAKMIAIWGGLEEIKDFTPAGEALTEDDALLHGPSLDDDQDISSQDDIDALFN